MRPETATRTLLSAESVADYLRGRGVIPALGQTQVRELAGGISNCVLEVRWPGGAVVVKQSLPRLRVPELWEFDPRRVLGECRCMEVLGGFLPPGAVPAVIDVDETALAFAMSRAPDGGEVWKDRLLQGAVDVTVARRAGDLLGAVHRGSAARPDLAAAFADLMPLTQGRTDPYHQATARAHPDLAPRIVADVRRLETARRTLVLGDYSPKNLIVYPDHVLALDFEVAHWGDPAFDTGFMLTHLLAKAIHRSEQSAEFLAAADVFWSAYRDAAGECGAREGDTVAECAVLLLCRVDGKSRLEYLTAAQQVVVRRVARELIAGDEREIVGLLGAVRTAASRSAREVR